MNVLIYFPPLSPIVCLNVAAVYWTTWLWTESSRSLEFTWRALNITAWCFQLHVMDVKPWGGEKVPNRRLLKKSVRSQCSFFFSTFETKTALLWSKNLFFWTFSSGRDGWGVGCFVKRSPFDLISVKYQIFMLFNNKFMLKIHPKLVLLHLLSTTSLQEQFHGGF